MRICDVDGAGEWVMSTDIRRDFRLKDCPYFIGPFAPSQLISKRTSANRKKVFRKNFVGPPKPRKSYGSKFDWAKDIDRSTPEGKKAYQREYQLRWYREASGSTGHQKKTELEKRDTKRARKRRQRKRQSDNLTEYFVRNTIKKQFGIKNPPQELIELKRVHLKVTRELR
jgi:hypothetical protein